MVAVGEQRNLDSTCKKPCLSNQNVVLEVRK